MTTKKTAEHSGIQISKLSVVAGKKKLLSDVNVDFPEGKISLIVGPSGVGKSILLRIIAGLIGNREEGIRYSGKIEINGRKTQCGKVGVVFQSFALFDELSPIGNLEFSRSSAGGEAHPMAPSELLETLRVPANVPTSRLSGGQRQRLAIARTLANNPPAILYDEPTSGLDPITGNEVADLIRTTHDQHGKTSLIVTHDYRSLLPIADHIFLLDPQTKNLVEVAADEWGHLAERLAPMASTSVAEAEVVQPEAISESVTNAITRFFVSSTNVFAALLIGLASLIPTWKNPKWGLRFFIHYAKLIAGPTAWFYLAAAGLVTGFVTTYFTFQFLPYSKFTEPLLIEDLLTALGFATYRLFVPVLATILVAARCGAAVTSDIGGRQFGNELDAMKSFGTTPRSYLLTPIMWSFLLGTPLLNFVAYWVARTTSLITFSFTHPTHGPEFWDYHYLRGLRVLEGVTYRGFGWLIAKLICCGLGVAIIAYYQGRTPKYSTTDVSRSVTATILWATLFVLLVHFCFSFYEFDNVIPGSPSNQAASQ